MHLSESDNTDLIRTIKRMSCAIFGHDHSRLKIVQTVVLNIVETVAALLINNDLVGSELENFTFEN